MSQLPNTKSANNGWNIRLASSRFTQLFNLALEKPQVVSRRKEASVTVVNTTEYNRMLHGAETRYKAILSMAPDPSLNGLIVTRLSRPRRNFSI